MAISDPAPIADIDTDASRIASILPEQRMRARLFFLAIGGAVLLGFVVRAAHVLAADFPLNDGGLFYAMVRDLQNAGYRLPDVTTYNRAGIPFSYAPLGFYVAAFLDDLTPLDLFAVFRFLPLVASGLSVAAFFLLARAMLSSRLAVVVAVFAFALIPRSFVWMLMGGGLTRSLGLLFALLALHQVYLLYTRREGRFILSAALFAGLTVLSHLETASFLAYSIVIFFLAYGRHRHGLVSSAAVALGTLAFTAPWWAAVLAEHGLAPFLAAGATGGTIFTGGLVRSDIVWSLVRFGASNEPLFPLIGTLALLGVLACLAARSYLLPAWWVTIILLDWRAFKTFTTVPIALLAGIGVVSILAPFMTRLPGQLAAGSQALRRLNDDRPARPWPDHALRALTLPLLLIFFLCYATFSALATGSAVGGEVPFLVSLSRDERAAMQWVAYNTPPRSRFLILTGSGWPTDKTSEWFPVLASRQSVATVQGYEWLPNGAFDRQIDVYDQAQGCALRASVCIGAWSKEWGIPFTHLYVPKTPAGQCCTTLLFSVGDDPAYDLVYDGPGATIYTRRTNGPSTPAARSDP